MNICVVLVAIFIAGASASDVDCFDCVRSLCKGRNNDVHNCNALQGGFIKREAGFHKLVVAQIEKSFEYLLLTINFRKHDKHRPGLVKLFKKMSNLAWDRSLDDIRYISKRGGKMNFANRDACIDRHFDRNEIDGMAMGLDSLKDLSSRINKVIESVSSPGQYFDSDSIGFLERKYFAGEDSLTDTIRYLSGNINDLANMIKGSGDPSLALHLFDDYLQKKLP